MGLARCPARACECATWPRRAWSRPVARAGVCPGRAAGDGGHRTHAVWRRRQFRKFISAIPQPAPLDAKQVLLATKHAVSKGWDKSRSICMHRDYQRLYIFTYCFQRTPRLLRRRQLRKSTCALCSLPSSASMRCSAPCSSGRETPSFDPIEIQRSPFCIHLPTSVSLQVCFKRNPSLLQLHQFHKT